MEKLSACLLVLSLSLSPHLGAQDDADVSAVLDRLHGAAARADLDTYFGLLAPDVVFLGTDGRERWQGQAFRDFVRPLFEQGKGWTYTPLERHISISADGRTAWFDESLGNEQLGRCRGSGVLVRAAGAWQLSQYNLSVPIPNKMVLAVVADIAAGEAVAAPAPGAAVSSMAPVVPAGERKPDAEPEAEAGAEAAQDVGEAPQKRCRKRFKTNRAANC